MLLSNRMNKPSHTEPPTECSSAELPQSGEQNVPSVNQRNPSRRVPPLTQGRDVVMDFEIHSTVGIIIIAHMLSYSFVMPSSLL